MELEPRQLLDLYEHVLTSREVEAPAFWIFERDDCRFVVVQLKSGHDTRTRAVKSNEPFAENEGSGEAQEVRQHGSLFSR
jgi:hypothetical protein